MRSLCNAPRAPSTGPSAPSMLRTRVDMPEIRMVFRGKVTENFGGGVTVSGSGGATSDDSHLLEEHAGSVVYDSEKLGYIAESRRDEYKERRE